MSLLQPDDAGLGGRISIRSHQIHGNVQCLGNDKIIVTDFCYTAMILWMEYCVDYSYDYSYEYD